jgi:hypothetical protein
MSFNIDNWKVKEMTDFKIPMDKLLELYEIETDHRKGVTFVDICEGEVHGNVVDGWFVPQAFRLYGEGSGTAMDDLEDDIFPYTTGTLKAVLIWEGGEMIERISVIDGVIEREEIDL